MDVTETPEPPVPYLGRYTMILVAGVAGLIVLNIVLGILAQVSLPAGAAAVIPPMIAGLVTGQTWGRERGALPEGAPAWRLSVFGALIYAGLQLLLALGGLAATGAAGPTAVGISLGIVLVVSVIVVFINRWFLTVGAKGILKQR